jgi:hypothetical protein
MSLQAENTAIFFIEKNHMRKRRATTYIALEEVDFIWSIREVIEFDRLWRDGYSIEYMADYFDRKPLEVLLLALDRAEKGKIKQRENGIWGKRS